MQEAIEKKKQQEPVFEAHKKEEKQRRAGVCPPAPAMTEGLMGLRQEARQEGKKDALASALEKSEKIAQMARKQFEKSVSVELAAMKKAAQKERKKAPERKKKPRYGWKIQDDSPPPKK
ncbi:MAG: hypothetical protein N3E51_04015 [Candidatus Micrarchaeota archaeon]|nr:hypothetical protein [Candidatus Micrarchaeota archaeon]